MFKRPVRHSCQVKEKREVLLPASCLRSCATNSRGALGFCRIIIASSGRCLASSRSRACGVLGC